MKKKKLRPRLGGYGMPVQLKHQIAVRLEEDLFKKIEAEAIAAERTIAEQVRWYITIARSRRYRAALLHPPLIMPEDVAKGVHEDLTKPVHVMTITRPQVTEPVHAWPPFRRPM